MKKATFLLVSLMMISCTFLYAQQDAEDTYELTVRMIDKKGKPLKAPDLVANIQGSGISYGLPENGIIRIPDVSAEDTLNIYSGRFVFDIPVQGLDSINVLFKKAWDIEGYYNVTADEIVNYGYYATKKRNDTAGGAVVNMEGAEKYKNLLELLKGKVSGVNVDERTGQVYIRGASSFKSNIEPIVVLDGVVMDVRSANRAVRPVDVQSITIDKIGTMYGSQGANGVIIITTKAAAN